MAHNLSSFDGREMMLNLHDHVMDMNYSNGACPLSQGIHEGTVIFIVSQRRRQEHQGCENQGGGVPVDSP